MQIKDYSSNKIQDKTLLHDLGGFSFFDKSVNTEQVNKDVKILSVVLKNAVSMNKEKKKLLGKLIKNIKQKKISFHNGLTYEKAVKLINLGFDDIADLVNTDKEKILYKIFQSSELKDFIGQKNLSKAKKYGISEQELYKWCSKRLTPILIRNGFLTTEQYETIYENLYNADLDNKEDIKLIEELLLNIFTQKQKEELEKRHINIKDFVKYLIYYGRNDLYRFSNLKRFLPLEYFNEKKREPIRNILIGKNAIKNNTVTGQAERIPVVKKFIPLEKTEKLIPKLSKNIQLIDVFKDHDMIKDTLKKAEKRYFKIPKILINIDSHSDLFIDTVPKGNISDWVNVVIKEARLTDVYWVIPYKFDDIQTFMHFFGYNKNQRNAFTGNYKENGLADSSKKFLTQTFLINVNTGTLIKDSVNYSKNKLKEELKTGKYRSVNIHTCTIESLPKINKNVILSVDADYFNCCGFDSDDILEQMPFDTDKEFNKFINFWDKKFPKANIIGLCISPEYIGYDSIGITRGFYEYLLSKIQNYSRKIY